MSSPAASPTELLVHRNPSDRRQSLVFEFVGVPGSGKTTLTTSVARNLRVRGLTVSEVYRDWNSGIFYRLKDNAASLARVAASQPAYALGSARTFVGLEAPRLKRAGNLSVNWLNRVSHVLQAQGTDGVHLFDQGVYQMLWSVGFASGQHALERLLSEITLPNIDGVFLLEADQAAVRRRLEGRAGRTSRLERDNRRGAFEEAFSAFDRVKTVVEQHSTSNLLGTYLSLDASRDDALVANAETATQLILKNWDESLNGGSLTGSKILR